MSMFLLLLLLLLLCALISFANSCSIVEIDVTFGAFSIQTARLDFGVVTTAVGVVVFVVLGNVFVFMFIARRLLSSLLEAIISRIIVELTASSRADDDDTSFVVSLVVLAKREFVCDNAISGFVIIAFGVPVEVVVAAVGIVVAFVSIFVSVEIAVGKVVASSTVFMGVVVVMVVAHSSAGVFVFSTCCPLDFDLRETQPNGMRRLP